MGSRMQQPYRLVAISLALSLVTLTGCKDKEPAGPAPAAPKSVPTEKAPEMPEPEAEKSISEADLQALLKTWLASQNEGNFKDYSEHYATKFSGIKRAGPKVTTFGRQDWLKDRERMFKKQMKVQALEPTFMIAKTTAGIQFEQIWESGDYKDKGPKQLSVVLEDGQLKIAREEMLRSQKLDEENPIPDYSPETVAIVIDESLVVISMDEDEVVHHPPKLMSPHGVAMAAVKDEKDLKSFIGREARVIGPDQTICTAKIESLHVYAGVEPHFGQIQAWTGEFGPAPSEDEIATGIWELAGTSRVVVGQLDKRCTGGLLATFDSEAPSTSLTNLDTSEETESAVKTAFRGLSGYKLIQKEFREEFKKEGFWDEEDSGGFVTYRAFASEGKLKYVSISVDAGPGCGDFGGYFWALYKIGADQKPVLLTDQRDPGEYFVPEATVVVNGKTYFLGENRIFEEVGATFVNTHSVPIHSYDCPC